MITLKKVDDIPNFSKIIPNDGRFKTSAKAIALHSPIGQMIRFSFEDFPSAYPSIEIWQSSIMPDHVHFILKINTKLEEHLGRYIARLKNMIKEKSIRRGILPAESSLLFEPGYNDQFLSVKRSLDNMIKYIELNPERLWSRMQNPNHFLKFENYLVGNVPCRVFGNLDILQNPFKYPVIYHRRYSDREYNELKETWEYGIWNGGVLVSGFIHPNEHEIMEAAISNGGKIIYLHYIPNNPRWKPSGKLFKLCEEGRLLIISPNEIDKFKTRGKEEQISREECLFLNSFAEKME